MRKRARFGTALVATVFSLLIISGAVAQSTPEASTENLQQYATTDSARLYKLSPDGTMVVGANEGRELCTYEVPSGEEIVCVDILEEMEIDIDPPCISWAPDSSAFAFCQPAFTQLRDSDIRVFDARTGEITNLTDDGFEDALPFFSDEKPNVTINIDIAPAWSPDGKSIAFSRSIMRPDTGATPNELWIVDVAGGEAHNVATIDAQRPGILYQGLLWSPDSETLYAGFRAPDLDDPMNGVYAIDAASGEAEQLAGSNADFNNDAPSVIGISPDGSTLIVDYPALLGSMTTGMEPGYGFLSVDGGEVEPIVPPADVTDDLPARAMMPAFTPDGSTLIYLVSRSINPPGLVIARDLATGAETTIASLPDNAMPIALYPGYTLDIGSNGIALVMFSQTDGYLVPVGGESGHPGRFEVGLPSPESAE